MKITKSFVLLAGSIAFASCQPKNTFSIEGTIENPAMEGKAVYLTREDAESSKRISDTTVVANGVFRFEGSVQEPQHGTIYVNPGDRKHQIRFDLALDNADITVKAAADGTTLVKGTPDNERYQEFQDAKRTYTERISKAYEIYETSAKTTEDQAKMHKERSAYQNAVDSLTRDYVKNNVNNPAFEVQLYNYAIMASLEEQKELMAAANERTSRQRVMKGIIERVTALENTAIGKPFIDFKMSDPEGQEVSLSDYVRKGKYVLIDFWASWCGPCRADIPHLKAIYQEYKDKGLEIVAVSFDDSEKAWKKAIKDLDLPWPHMSDLKVWNSAAAKSYAISSIPHTILLNQEGIIVDRNLRGERLKKKLAELMP